MVNSKLIFLFILFYLMVSKANSQVITDRPDQTESSSTIKTGDLQLESGLLIGFEGKGESKVRQILAPTTLFRYGLNETFELRILSQYESLKTNKKFIDGISDLEIGTKIQLYQKENVNTEIAFLSHLILPTGTDGFTTDSYGTINKLSIAHDISENIAIGYNLGYNYFGEQIGDLTYSVALGIGVNDRVGVYIEPYGDLQNFKNHIANFDAGCTFLINEDLQIDFSFGTGINNKMNYISLGASWLIKKTKSI